MAVALLADNLIISPDSQTSLPGSKFAVSLASIGKSLIISVVTAIPAVVLTCDNETVFVELPTFAACANKTTPEYPTDAVYIPTELVGATCVMVLNTFSANAILLISS